MRCLNLLAAVVATSFLAVGCDSSSPSAPGDSIESTANDADSAGRVDVDVNAGGVDVKVDPKKSGDEKRGIDVEVGGPNGVDVDID